VIPVAGMQMSPQDVDGEMMEQQLEEHRATGDNAAVPAAAPVPVNQKLFPLGSDQLPNGKGVPSASSSTGNRLNSASRLRSVLVAVAAVLICALIGAIVMFEFDGNVPFSASLHALPALSHFRHKVYHPLSAVIGRSLTS